MENGGYFLVLAVLFFGVHAGNCRESIFRPILVCMSFRKSTRSFRPEIIFSRLNRKANACIFLDLCFSECGPLTILGSRVGLQEDLNVTPMVKLGSRNR